MEGSVKIAGRLKVKCGSLPAEIVTNTLSEKKTVKQTPGFFGEKKTE